MSAEWTHRHNPPVLVDPDPPEFRARRLALMSVDGSIVSTLNLTGIPNANSQVPMKIEVQQACDLGHWHYQTGQIAPLWGSD